MNLNCGCVIKYFVPVYSGMCWVLNKIYKFKCGNNTKTETALKKYSILGLGSYQNRSKKGTFGLGCNQNRGQKGIKFKKEKHIWPRVQGKPRPKGDRIYKKKKKEVHMAPGGTKIEAKRPGSMASGSTEPR